MSRFADQFLGRAHAEERFGFSKPDALQGRRSVIATQNPLEFLPAEILSETGTHLDQTDDSNDKQHNE
jgi:hypothetical protein